MRHWTSIERIQIKLVQMEHREENVNWRKT
jgi:hypothetical protein